MTRWWGGAGGGGVPPAADVTQLRALTTCHTPRQKAFGDSSSSLCLHLGVSLGPEDSWTVIKEHSRLNLGPRAPQTSAQQLAAITGSVMGGCV